MPKFSLNSKKSSHKNFRLNWLKISQQAFTLIEVIVAVTIIALIAAVSIPGFRNFNQTQELESVRSRLYDDLRLAQSKANNGVVCPGVQPQVASLQIEWGVEIRETGYLSSYNCINDTNSNTGGILQTTDSELKSFPANASVKLARSDCGQSGNTPIAPYISFFSRACSSGSNTCKNFEIRCGGSGGQAVTSNQPFEIVLKNAQNIERKIIISQGGAIYVAQ